MPKIPENIRCSKCRYGASYHLEGLLPTSNAIVKITEPYVMCLSTHYIVLVARVNECQNFKPK